MAALPTWLSPIQAEILNITDKQAEYCSKIGDLLKKVDLGSFGLEE